MIAVTRFISAMESTSKTYRLRLFSTPATLSIPELSLVQLTISLLISFRSSLIEGPRKAVTWEKKWVFPHLGNKNGTRVPNIETKHS